MKCLLAAVYLALLVATPNISRAEDITRFAPLKADELTPPQKAWADMIAAPPRNAKFVNPPYRAYIRNPDLAPPAVGLVGLSALEYVAAAAPERARDIDRRPAVDRAI